SKQPEVQFHSAFSFPLSCTTPTNERTKKFQQVENSEANFSDKPLTVNMHEKFRLEKLFPTT
ncbi:MAG: hypothetical protein ACYC9O_19640, partial [Candidatus Latescibacterota bacterium]